MRLSIGLCAVVLFFAAMAAALAPEMLSGSAPPSDAWLFKVAVVGAAAGAVLLALLDLYMFAWVIALFGGFVLAATALAFSVAPPELGGLLVPAAAGALMCAVGGGYVVWSQRRNDRIPNVLLQYFPRSAVREKNAVQVAFVGPDTLRAGERGRAEAFLQNCSDQPKSVRISLLDRFREVATPALGWRLPDEIRLGPSEVKRVTIPIWPKGGAGGTRRLFVGLDVQGDAGKRTRRWRASLFVAKPTALEQVFAAAMHVPPEAGTIYLDVVVEPTPSRGEPSMTEGSEEELLWQPSYLEPSG